MKEGKSKRTNPGLKQRLPGLTGVILCSPTAIYLFLFLIIPLILVMIYSFLTNGSGGSIVFTFTLDNYARFFTRSVYSQILFHPF